MGVELEHPLYSKNRLDWEDIETALGGQRAIKSKNTLYLPYTAGMIEADKLGLDPRGRVYSGYLARAQYPEWVRDSVRSMIGLVSRINPKYELKHKQLEILEEKATDDGFDLKELFVRLVSKGVEFGRYGLLSEFDDSGEPYITIYDASNIINWRINAVGGRRDATMIVLREYHLKGEDEFSNETETKYRVLDLDEMGFYRVRIFDSSGVPENTIEPKMGSKRLNFIPFTFGGSINNNIEPNPIPLLTMAQAAIKSYQLSADYFQSLYMTAHPQPYAVGVDPVQVTDDEGNTTYESPLRMTGAICLWELPQGATVNYLEIQGNGIALTKTELESQKNAALESGAKVIDAGSNESGEARKARQDDQHATLHTIVSAAASAIEQAIKYLALWLGKTDEGIQFEAALEFNADVNPQILAGITAMAQSGKISWETVYDYIQTGKISKRTYDEEIDKMLENDALLPLTNRTQNNQDID